MVDEFDEIEKQRKPRWIAVLVVNVVILAMVALAAYVLLTRSGVITIPAIVASRTSQVSADQEGRIIKILVEENEQFRVGMPLFQIENPDVRTKIEGLQKIIAGYDQQIAAEQSELSRRLRESDLKVKIQTVKHEIEKKQVGLKNAQLELENADHLVAYAKAELEKAQTLFTSGALTAARVEVYRSACEGKLAERNKIIGAIALLQTETRGDEKLLHSYAQQMDDLTSSTAQRVSELLEKKTTARTELAAWESARERLVRKADRNGSVAVRHKEEGEAVKPGEPVLEVTTGEDIWVEAYFRPEDVNLIRAGDPLVARYANRMFPVAVESIGLITKPFPLQRASMLASTENFVVAKLIFVQPDQAKGAGLRPGMKVDTELSRQEGLLYRLGLKQPTANAATKSPQESNGQPRRAQTQGSSPAR